MTWIPPYIFSTKFGISWGVPGIWLKKQNKTKSLHLLNLTAEQYQKLNDEKRKCECLGCLLNTLRSVFSMNVYYIGLCFAEMHVVGWWSSAWGHVFPVCITVYVGLGRDARRGLRFWEQSVVQRQDHEGNI